MAMCFLDRDKQQENRNKESMFELESEDLYKAESLSLFWSVSSQPTWEVNLEVNHNEE